jgi:UDP-glucose 4-epimerase
MCIIELYGLDYFVFRLSNPYGERQNPLAAQGAIPVFIYHSINGETINIWGNGEVIRDYIYIKDAVKVLSAALSKNSNDRIFNLSSAKGYSLNQILEFIEEVSGEKNIVEYKDGRNIDVSVNILDNDLVKKTFDWEPETDIKAGIKLTYNYLLKQNAR